MIREQEPVSCGLQPGEDQDQGVFEDIGAAGIGAGQLGKPLGLLLAVACLTMQVLDHPAGGIGLGSGILVIGFQLLSQLADGGGELLGLDAQLPEGAGSLQGEGRPAVMLDREGLHGHNCCGEQDAQRHPGPMVQAALGVGGHAAPGTCRQSGAGTGNESGKKSSLNESA